MHFLIINGPNINMLGIREPKLYGKQNYQALCDMVENKAKDMGVQVTLYQSNHEGDLVDAIQEARNYADGIVINAAAYTHTSVAILDAIKAVAIPAVEVHITEPNDREEFRHISYVGKACFTRFAGYGLEGYLMAMDALSEHLNKEK